MFNNFLRSLAVTAALSISLAGYALAAEGSAEQSVDVPEFSDENVTVDYMDTAEAGGDPASGSVSLNITLQGDIEGYNGTSVKVEDETVANCVWGRNELTLNPENIVNIVTSPKPGYYALLEITADNITSSHINECKRIYNKSKTYVITITFRPISITAVTVNCGGTARTDRYDDSYSTAGTDTGTTLRLLDLLKDGHYPAYAAADSDSITDRLYSITVTKMRSGLKEYPEEGAESLPILKPESLTFNRELGTGHFENDEMFRWTDFVNGAYEEYGMADLTSVEVELDYEKGYEYTFSSDSDDSSWEAFPLTVYPRDMLTAGDFTGV